MVASNDENVARRAVQARGFAERWFSSRRAAERCVAAFEEALKASPER